MTDDVLDSPLKLIRRNCPLLDAAEAEGIDAACACPGACDPDFEISASRLQREREQAAAEAVSALIADLPDLNHPALLRRWLHERNLS